MSSDTKPADGAMIVAPGDLAGRLLLRLCNQMLGKSFGGFWPEH
jgi:hypothetical protein